MEEKLEKQEDVELCSNCSYVFKNNEENNCPECGEWGRNYGVKITTSKIYTK